MLRQQSRRDGDLAGRYARLATWQSGVSSEQAVERQADLLVALYGERLAQDEAKARASAARAYSNPLSADFWECVAAAIRRKIE